MYYSYKFKYPEKDIYYILANAYRIRQNIKSGFKFMENFLYVENPKYKIIEVD